MKNKTIFLLVAACGLIIAMLCAGCGSNSYANDLKSEKALIKDYIKRQNINIIYEAPAADAWGENDYLEIDDYLYFHLVNPGDTTGESVKYGDNVNLRYLRYTLNVDADTSRYWTTADAAQPVTFKYGYSASSSTTFCSGWQYAIGYMKYSGSQAKIICPSKLGFDADQEAVIPYGYDLKILIEKW